VLISGLVVILVAAAILSVWPYHSSTPSPVLQQAVVSSLSQDTPTAPARNVRTTLTAWGDLNVEYALRDRGSPEGNRAAALDDMLAITRAVYQTPEPRPLNVTLIGVWRGPGSTGDVPVLYASMPADRLAGRNWPGLRADDLEQLGMVRWLPSGLCEAWRECGASAG
jgi:hypothetical protein